MTRQEIENVLASLFRKRSVSYDAPKEDDWTRLKAKFGTTFSQPFVDFMDLVSSYHFRGEILNVSVSGNISSNDTVELSYDFETKNGSWNKDMIPFYSIGNGDYFCLSASAGATSPVFYVYHEDGRIERYSENFEQWVRQLASFFAK